MKFFKRLMGIICVFVALFACSACGQTPPPPHAHNLTVVAARTAGYATHGNSTYYECDGCDKIFKDAQGTQETTLQQVRITSQTKFDKKQYVKDNYTLNYCLYEPENLDKEQDEVPLILFLHGAGERGSNNEWQLKNAILQVVKTGNENSNWMKSVIIAPQCPSSTGGNTNSSESDPNKWVETPWGTAPHANYNQSSVAISNPLKYALELVKEYATYDYIDADRIYVIGLSMGGFGTWDALAREPDLFAAGVPICGGGPSDKIDVLKNIPIYTFHGSSDTVVRPAGTQAMYDAINNAGGNKIIYYVFSGQGHGIWNNSITFAGSGTQYPALETWLFEQSK